MTLDQFVSILQLPSLRGLTVPQPYASMIRTGKRTIVVRLQYSVHRGCMPAAWWTRPRRPVRCSPWRAWRTAGCSRRGVVGLFSLAISTRMRGVRERQGLWTPTDRERRQIITAARRYARSRGAR